MSDLFFWWPLSLMPKSYISVALICAICGALVLSLFTRWIGLGTLAINTLVLFVGAMLANMITIGLDLPFDSYYVRPVLVSFSGMAVSSIFVLMLFARHASTE